MIPKYSVGISLTGYLSGDRSENRSYSVGVSDGRRAYVTRCPVLRRSTVSVALGLTLGATLGIPRLSVGAHAIGVGADRLARALAARRQGLAVGAERRGAAGACRSPPAIWRARAGGGAARTCRARTATTATGTRGPPPGPPGPRPESAIDRRRRARAWTTLAGRPDRTLPGDPDRRTSRPWTARTAAAAAAPPGPRAAGRSPRGPPGPRGTAWATGSRDGPTGTGRPRPGPPRPAIAEVARRRRELPADAGARHLAATRTIVVFLLFFSARRT